MKWLAALLLVGAGIAHADIKLEFVEKTIPAYPAELRQAAITGSVRVGFNVHADGTVSDVNIIQSSEPAFIDAALVAVRQWRFKPWRVSADNPAMINVQNDLIFRLNDKQELWESYERAGLILMTCKQFNDEVAQYREDDPARSLSDMKTTLLSIRMISLATEDGITSYKKSLASTASFEKALPQIIERCQTYPGLDFVDIWPAALRERLAQKR
ncbi:transport protein TonB [compost metagenome]